MYRLHISMNRNGNHRRYGPEARHVVEFGCGRHGESNSRIIYSLSACFEYCDSQFLLVYTSTHSAIHHTRRVWKWGHEVCFRVSLSPKGTRSSW